jgi:tRNA(His) guanylyltransferase
MSKDKSTLGDRMKDYESIRRGRLLRKMPVILRLDGKAFHTLTRGMNRPYDPLFQGCMWITAQRLCEEVQGCRLAYVQSDEISLLLTDYESIDTEGWFGYDIQKMTSVAASIATAHFNMQFALNFPEKGRVAYFDCRAFNLPMREVCNYFIWRQQDATRNSIQMLGQAHFSHKQLHKKNTKDIQEMLFQEYGINWNDECVPFKRGVCVRRVTFHLERETTTQPEGYVRHRWDVDTNTPIFTQDRQYIDELVYPPDVSE